MRYLKSDSPLTLLSLALGLSAVAVASLLAVAQAQQRGAASTPANERPGTLIDVGSSESDHAPALRIGFAPAQPTSVEGSPTPSPGASAPPTITESSTAAPTGTPTAGPENVELHGSVYWAGSGSTAIKGARIRVRPCLTAHQPFETTSDSSGQYRLVLPASYFVPQCTVQIEVTAKCALDLNESYLWLDLMAEPQRTFRLQPIVDCGGHWGPLFLPRVISQRPPAESYLFVENREEVEYGPACPGFGADGDDYRFEPSSGVLTVHSSAPRLEPADAGYLGSDVVFSGTAGGAVTDLRRVYRVPHYTDEFGLLWITGGDLTVELPGRAGEFEEVTLATGETVQRQWSRRPSPLPGCIVTTTLAITNFGYQDRAKIVYDD